MSGLNKKGTTCWPYTYVMSVFKNNTDPISATLCPKDTPSLDTLMLSVLHVIIVFPTFSAGPECSSGKSEKYQAKKSEPPVFSNREQLQWGLAAPASAAWSMWLKLESRITTFSHKRTKIITFFLEKHKEEEIVTGFKCESVDHQLCTKQILGRGNGTSSCAS